jgi:selenium metabolism protein YedF
MARELDCRGLACPAPVLQTKELIEQEHPESLIVLVDNEAARQNVSRFLSTQNFAVSVEEKEGQFRITGSHSGAPQVEAPAVSPDAAEKKIMVMVATDRMGVGDDELGRKLLFNFLKTLKEMGPQLWRLVFVNNGVKLTIEGAETLPILQGLAAEGVTILVCGTCLDHFKLLEKKQIGETTNMLDIVTAMQLADSVVNL